jgi:thiol-disulfide isomerase/thioredoxin
VIGLRPTAFTIAWLSTALLFSGIINRQTNAAEPIDFALTSISGEQQRLSDYLGRWVVVNYWATWCPPCRKELPELDLFNEQHQDDAVVLGINFEDISERELQAFIDEQFLSFPMFRERPSRSTPFGRLSGLPTTYLLNPEGVPVAMHTGGITADELNFFISNYPGEDEPLAEASSDKQTDKAGSEPGASPTASSRPVTRSVTSPQATK